MEASSGNPVYSLTHQHTRVHSNLEMRTGLLLWKLRQQVRVHQVVQECNGRQSVRILLLPAATDSEEGLNAVTQTTHDVLPRALGGSRVKSVHSFTTISY